MALVISAKCPQCLKRGEVIFEGNAVIPCPECHQNFLPHVTDDLMESGLLNQCPVCGCSDLYKQKDFNRKVGVGLIIVGVCLSFFTYGISLVVVTLLDWWLFRKVDEVGCCYLCRAVFRDGEVIRNLPHFDLVLHDHYRNVREAKATSKADN